MDLTEMKVNNTNIVNITDSLKAPLLRLNIKNTSNTTIPAGNELIVYVDKNSEVTSERKTYIFTLSKPLQFTGSTTDEFIIEPVIDDNKITMKAYVKRRIENGVVLNSETIEEVETQAIMLFEGVNYISTNYTNADINIVYPKNKDLLLYFLNNAVYGYNQKDKVLTLDDIYFKDCFTEVEAGINAVFNKITIKCMDSENQNFSLDCDGNLVVNSITTRQTNQNTAINFDNIYPVGAVYISMNSTNPSTLFGGTWEQIVDRFLLACGNAYAAGSTGGEATHQLTVNEMPKHRHQVICSYNSEIGLNLVTSNNGVGTTGDATYLPIRETGGDEAHNNMPPYLAVYMWKRIA